MQTVSTYKPKIDPARLAAIGASAVYESRPAKLAEKVEKKDMAFKHPDCGQVPKALDRIIKAVAEYFYIAEPRIMSSSRLRSVDEARQVMMYLARTHTSMSLREISLAFNRNCHSTTLHGWKRVKGLIETDQRIAVAVMVLEKQLGFHAV